MTYTVIGHDPATGEVGIGIATYSLAVGASCPFIRVGAGAVSTQAATHSSHGPALLKLLFEKNDLPTAFAKLRAADPHFEYRQIGVVTAQGAVHVHTGSQTRDWAGAVTGEGWLTMGNVLQGKHVVRAMADAYQQESSHAGLAGRLMAALEAGRDAGGQRGENDRHLLERSTVLTVYGDTEYPALDLRVDDDSDAVTELRRIFDRFARVAGYYNDRSEIPDQTPPQDRWMAERGME